MAASWLRWLTGSRRRPIKEKTLRKYRARYARHVPVRTFHSNVLHWLQCADDALAVMARDDVFDQTTHVLLMGRTEMSLEAWFSDDRHHYPPHRVWEELVARRQSLDDALNEKPASTQYYRRQTKGLYDDLVEIEKALYRIEDYHDTHHKAF